jgi:hypothetical protein
VVGTMMKNRIIIDVDLYRCNVIDKSTGLFPELTLEELAFLHHEYYSIFLLQQEASAL